METQGIGGAVGATAYAKGGRVPGARPPSKWSNAAAQPCMAGQLHDMQVPIPLQITFSSLSLSVSQPSSPPPPATAASPTPGPLAHLHDLPVLELDAHALALLLQAAYLGADVAQVALELAQHALHGSQDVVTLLDLHAQMSRPQKEGM
jgi:hypothetical protein